MRDTFLSPLLKVLNLVERVSVAVLVFPSQGLRRCFYNFNIFHAGTDASERIEDMLGETDNV